MSTPATRVAAVRGAIQVPKNHADAIRDSTARLLEALMAKNGLTPVNIVSAIFTATPDLTADFPAHAARRLGWTDVPLLGATEVDVPRALPRIVRVLLTVELGGAKARRGGRLAPVYLDGAEALRPDLARGAGTPAAAHAAGPRTRVAIVGLGQIGGSIGLALGAAGGWERVGFDRSANAARAALARGAVDRVAGSLGEACAGAALAVVAVPVDALPVAIDRVAAALPKGAALVDTGSARGAAGPALARAEARGVHAVGGHPIAGNEGRGIASARADLFRGAAFALLPLPGRGVPASARRLVKDVGARALVVRPAAHDRALARTSHLPYLVAVALAQTGRAAAARGLAGPGFRSMTRLSAMDPRVAGAYCKDNAKEIAEAWRTLRAALDASVRRLGPGGAARPRRGSSRGLPR